MSIIKGPKLAREQPRKNPSQNKGSQQREEQTNERIGTIMKIEDNRTSHVDTNIWKIKAMFLPSPKQPVPPSGEKKVQIQIQGLGPG